MNKSELVRWLTEEQQKWELLIAAIGEDRMAQAGINGEWSMKDIIIHLTVWQRNHIVRLEAIVAEQPAPAAPWPSALTTEDEINAWMYQTHHEHTVRQVLDDAAAVYEQTMAFVNRLPDDTQVETIEGKFHAISLGGHTFAVGEFFHHFYDDHAADVLAWLSEAANPNFR